MYMGNVDPVCVNCFFFFVKNVKFNNWCYDKIWFNDSLLFTVNNLAQLYVHVVFTHKTTHEKVSSEQ